MGAAIGPGGYAVLIFGDRTGSAGVYAGAGQVWVKVRFCLLHHHSYKCG